MIPNLNAFEESMLKILDAGKQVDEGEKRRAWSFYLQNFRRNYELTQEELAQVTGLVPFTISAHECQRRTPKIETAVKVVDDMGHFKRALEQVVEERRKLLEEFAPERKKGHRPLMEDPMNPLLTDREAFLTSLSIMQKEIYSLAYLEDFLKSYFKLLRDWLQTAPSSEISDSLFCFLTGPSFSLAQELLPLWIQSRREKIGREILEKKNKGF